MERSPAHRAALLKTRGSQASTANPHFDRKVVDLLPDDFAVERSESEWLLTLLSAAELAYIFGGPTNGRKPD